MGNRFDVAVIGGGPAGYIAAIRAADRGAKVALIERDALGGTCLNRGCIPTKAFLHTAETIENLRVMSKIGAVVGATGAYVDMGRVVENKNRIVSKLVAGVNSLVKARDIEFIRGAGTLERARPFVDGKDIGGAAQIILCNGSRTNKPPIEGIDLDGVITSTEILDLKEIPESLLIIGAGVIGVEMARAFSAFGSRVEVVEALDRVLPMMDAEISVHTAKKLKEQGIAVTCGVKINRIQKDGAALTVQIEGGHTIRAAKVLVSAGRVPDTLSLAGAGLSMQKGAIVADSAMRTSIPNVFAAGDATAKCMLAHAAYEMGETAAVNATGGDRKADLRYVPMCVYGFPEIGSVGLSEEAAQKYGRVRIGRFPYMANGRALASEMADGFAKVIVGENFGEILGVHLVGPGAAEVINEAAALMAGELTANEAARIVHGHPTYSEAMKEAFADALGECPHLPPKQK